MAATRKRMRAIARFEAKRVLDDAAEDKVSDFFLAVPPAPVLSTPGLNPCTNVGQGTDYFQRSGMSVRGKSLFIRWQVRRSLLAAALTGNITRLALILDTQSDALLPSPAGTASSILSGTSTVAQFNPLTRVRFVVLWTKTVVVDANRPVVAGKKFVRLKNPVISYLTASGAAPASLGKNNCYFLWWGDLPVGVDNPQLDYNIRFRYEDL